MVKKAEKSRAKTHKNDSPDNKFKSKYKNNPDFRISMYKTLLRLTDDKNPQYPKQIARQLGVKYTTLHYRIKQLERSSFIKKELRSNITIYSLTDSGKLHLESLKPNANPNFSVPHKVRHENICYIFPLIKDNPEAEWQGTVNHHTWESKKDVLTHPINMTIEKTTKSVKIYFHKMYFERNLKAKDAKDNMIRRALTIADYHLKKKGIIISLFEGRTMSSEEANEMPQLEGKLDKSRKKSMTFERKARNILPDSRTAKAWIDHSPGLFPDWETNDFEYEDKLLLMPEYIDIMFREQKHLKEQQNYIMQNQVEFATNIKLHMKVLTEMSKTMKAIRESLEKK